MDQYIKAKDLPAEIVDVYQKKAAYPLKRTALLAVAAGLMIGLGAFASMVASHGLKDFGIAKLVAGAVFPIGLMMVLVTGSDLFTGSTMMMVAVADKRITLKRYLINLTEVWFFNFMGAILLTLTLLAAGSFSMNEPALLGAVLKTAQAKVSADFWQALFSGIACNFMVAGAVYMSFASKDIVSKLFISWFIIGAFIIAGFQHSVANMFYLSAAYLAIPGSLSLSQIFLNLIPVTIGNIIGGGVFVALLFYYAYKD